MASNAGDRDCCADFAGQGSCSLSCATRGTGAGASPVLPALLAMSTLLQCYHGVSDAEAVELTVVDLRWQMVLDRIGSADAAFAQPTRMIEHGSARPNRAR
jgi:hypothetical protein